jgi:hypothetical protein
MSLDAVYIAQGDAFLQVYQLMSTDEMNLFNLQHDAKKMIWAGHVSQRGE